jgi:hypothetical protein
MKKIETISVLDFRPDINWPEYDEEKVTVAQQRILDQLKNDKRFYTFDAGFEDLTTQVMKKLAIQYEESYPTVKDLVRFSIAWPCINHVTKDVNEISFWSSEMITYHDLKVWFTEEFGGYKGTAYE